MNNNTGFDRYEPGSCSRKAADVYLSSRDLVTTRLYLEECIFWARFLKIAAENLGEQIIQDDKQLTAYVLRFKTGCCIYSLSSHPDALLGKHGHIKLDEFAVHERQRDLYRYAMPCTTWGYPKAGSCCLLNCATRLCCWIVQRIVLMDEHADSGSH